MESNQNPDPPVNVLQKAQDFVESKIAAGDSTSTATTGREKVQDVRSMVSQVADEIARQGVDSATSDSSVRSDFEKSLGAEIQLVHDEPKPKVDQNQPALDLGSPDRDAYDTVRDAMHSASDAFNQQLNTARDALDAFEHSKPGLVDIREAKIESKNAADRTAERLDEDSVRAIDQTFSAGMHSLIDQTGDQSAKGSTDQTEHGVWQAMEQFGKDASDRAANIETAGDYLGQHIPDEQRRPDPVSQDKDLLGAVEDDLVQSGFPNAGDKIGSVVTEMHQQVDSLIEMYGSGTRAHDTEYGSSAEEQTFDRRGPLTIPTNLPTNVITMKSDQVDDTNNSPVIGEENRFSSLPRPPTPPKALDDEDMKPSTIEINAAPRSYSLSDQPRSILKKGGQSSKLDFISLDPRVLDLIYWRDQKKSAVILGLSVLTLLVFAKFPLIAICSYSGLAVLGGTLGFRLFKLIEAQIKKTDSTNPFQPYLNQEIHVPQDKVHRQVDVLLEHAQILCNELKRLFLVENIVDSVKFGILLWALTYISSWFSVLCLLILLVLGIFTVPKVYEVYQEPIDKNITIAKEHVNNVTKKISDKLPAVLKKTADAESHEKSN